MILDIKFGKGSFWGFIPLVLAGCLIAITVGCDSSKEESLEVGVTEKVEPVIQTCAHCGGEVYVYPLDGSEVSPTTDWCFECGKIDQKGLELLIEAESTKGVPEKKLLVGRKIFDYAEENFAFRAALFPDQETYESMKQEFEIEWKEFR